MSVTIRSAGKEDCTDLTNLTNQLGYPSSPQKTTEIIDLVMNNDNHQVFIAEVGETVVGYVHLVGSLQVDTDPFVEIAALIVHDEFRHQGVGQGLIDQTVEWAGRKNQNNIRIRINLIEEKAYSFFEQNGFQKLESQKLFLKDLDMGY